MDTFQGSVESASNFTSGSKWFLGTVSDRLRPFLYVLRNALPKDGLLYFFFQ